MLIYCWRSTKSTATVSSWHECETLLNEWSKSNFPICMCNLVSVKNDVLAGEYKQIVLLPTISLKKTLLALFLLHSISITGIIHHPLHRIIIYHQLCLPNKLNCCDRGWRPQCSLAWSITLTFWTWRSISRSYLVDHASCSVSERHDRANWSFFAADRFGLPVIKYTKVNIGPLWEL